MTETTQNASATEPKTTKGKGSKKLVKTKSVPKTKLAKAARKTEPKARKAKAPRDSRDGWGTFALRLPVPEREAFHKAAGPAGASRFARTVLVAFANEDEGAFKNAIAEARKLRA